MFIHWETHIEGWSHKSGNKQAKMLRLADSGWWENGKLLFSSSGFSGFAFFFFFFNFPPNKNRKFTDKSVLDWTAGLNVWVYCGSMWLPHPWRVKGPRVSPSVLSSSLFKLRPVLISFSRMALNNQPRPLSWTPDSYISSCPLTSAAECPKRHLKFRMSKIELLIPLFSKAKSKQLSTSISINGNSVFPTAQAKNPGVILSLILFSHTPHPTHQEILLILLPQHTQNLITSSHFLHNQPNSSHRHLLPILL